MVTKCYTVYLCAIANDNSQSNKQKKLTTGIYIEVSKIKVKFIFKNKLSSHRD